MKFEVKKAFSFFFFALACERILIKTHSIESRCYRTGKYIVCKRVRASFSPDILQAGAVKGLRKKKKEFRLDSSYSGFIDADVSNVGGYKRND